jgi:hypothetical protein
MLERDLTNLLLFEYRRFTRESALNAMVGIRVGHDALPQYGGRIPLHGEPSSDPLTAPNDCVNQFRGTCFPRNLSVFFQTKHLSLEYFVIENTYPDEMLRRYEAKRSNARGTGARRALPAGKRLFQA